MRVRSLVVGLTLVMASSSVAVADDDPVTVEVDPKINAQSWAQTSGGIPPPEEITVVFTGDTLIHGSLANAARVRGGYDFRPMFSDVKHLIAQADLAICHLEVPLSPTSSNLSSYPLFNAPREVADALVWAGYDGCSTASNHSIDKGVPGIGGTLEVLEGAGLVHSGMAAEPTDGWEAAMYELDGVTVANISATYWLNGRVMPRDQQYLVQLLDVDQIITAAAGAKGDGADLVVVSMHCCTEYRHQPTTVQRETSHRLIESEFIDLVVTHHSHVVGPVEKVGNEFVVHGIGNFLSGMHSDPRTSDGLIVHANAVNTGTGWRFDSIDVTATDVTSRGWRIFLPEPGSASYNRTMGVVSSMGAPFGLYEIPGLSPAELALIE